MERFQLGSPVWQWWLGLGLTSVVNLLLWVLIQRRVSGSVTGDGEDDRLALTVVTLSGLYTVICAFRSIWPRADVERFTLFGGFVSTVLVGRAVATVAELCFVAQWSLLLRRAARVAHAPVAERIAASAFPLICVAECFSWYAVISTNFIGNVVEESIWTATGLIAIASQLLLLRHYGGFARRLLRLGIGGASIYVAFMALRDVPMYWHRWLADEAAGKAHFSFSEGLRDLATRCVVTDDIANWRAEIPWMTLYFSVAVWLSLALCIVPLQKSSLQRYLADLPSRAG